MTGFNSERFVCRELSSEKENYIRKQNDMTADIEKLIRHNEELLSIKNQLRSKGLVNTNRFLNSNTNFKNQSQFDQLDSDNPRPLLFVSNFKKVFSEFTIIIN